PDRRDRRRRQGPRRADRRLHPHAARRGTVDRPHPCESGERGRRRMSLAPAPIVLSRSDEERAQRLHRESTVFICHDHSLFPEDFAAMARGGVTAKQLMLSVDARLHAERETFLASIEGRGYARESKRHERAVGTVDEEIVARPLGATESDGFLKSALVAMDYVYWQVERSKGRIRVALEPDDVRAA